MFDLQGIQRALGAFQLDGWLLYDFRGSNLLARRILDLAERPVGSRRFFYFVPARGEPRKLVHRIESAALDHLPGPKTVYLTWQELDAGVQALVRGAAKVAMEYSPNNANPYISRVDAGTIELVRAAGAEPCPSGDLIQQFEATWDDEQWAMHLEAARHTRSAFDEVFAFIGERAKRNRPVSEVEAQKVILDWFKKHGLVTYSPPIVAVGPNSGDPHYETGTGKVTSIGPSDFVLVDLWARMDRARSVYSDLTHVGFVGAEVPQNIRQVFDVVARARDAAIDYVRKAFGQGRTIQGWEVDDACRRVVVEAGYGDFFVHRTGHSIGQEVHGNGANIDNLETREDRRILPRTCFSVEPGIYLPEFGIRSEVNVFVDAAGQVHVTGGNPQDAVRAILAAA